MTRAVRLSPAKRAGLARVWRWLRRLDVEMRTGPGSGSRYVRCRPIPGMVAWAGVLAALSVVHPACGTWSVIIVDSRTGEVSVGAATCLTGFNLKNLLPVVRVGRGAGAAQSLIDSGAVNRKKIWDGLGSGASPQSILATLAAGDSKHQQRQYGIVDTKGQALTFTGGLCGAFADGVVGQSGTLIYAVQGNVLTGQPVIDAAEAAILETPGGIPEKLMAAMEAARLMGGDGRCSCSPSDPDGCGSPPPSFTKSAHIGFMIDSRAGDFEGFCTSSQGCANGVYYMSFNILASTSLAVDPVIQMKELFGPWRESWLGLPDAVVSTCTMIPPHVLDTGGQQATLVVEVRDWQGTPVEGDLAVKVSLDPNDGPGSVTVGPALALGGGMFHVPLTAGTSVGLKHFTVTVNDFVGDHILMPQATLLVQDHRADLSGDGVIDQSDLGLLLSAYGTSAAGDIDGDGVTDQIDLGLLLAQYPS
jgi:hypothetical protein